MAITDINISGKIYQDDGGAVNGATVALLETGTSTQEASTTSDSNGAWSFTETSLDATYDIKITSGTSVRYILWSDEITTKGVDTASLKVRGVEGAAAPIYFFADQADQDIDVWRINAADGGILTFDNRASGSSDSDLVAQMTITPHATVASSSVTFPGILDVNGTADFDVTDFDIASSGDIDLVSTNDAAAAIYLRENAGTSGTVKIHADQGTSVTEGAESINILSDAGGVGIRSTANLAKAVNITSDGGTTGSISIFNDQGTSVTEGAESISLLSDAGGVGIRSTANLANAVNLTVDGGTSSTMTLFNDQGTAATEGAASIQLLSDVGGINVKSGLNAASAILLTADGGTSETIVVHADQGTGTGSIQLLSDAGGITLTSGVDIDLAATSDVNLPANVGLTFGDDGEKIEGDGTNLVVESSGTLDMNSGGVLTLDSGAAINIEPASGSAILLDGTISVDAGVVTGATSITSTNFVGTVTTATQNSITTMTGLVTTGALNSGSITSGFGTIDTGSSAITTTGLISGGSLDVDDVLINGTTIGHTDDTDLMTVADGVLTVAGELDAATLDISGNADIDGTTNLDAVDIDGNVQLDGTFITGATTDGYDVKFWGNTSNTYMLWDESTDDLVLTLGAELYFYDAAGGEHIKSDGTDMTIYAGTDLNLTVGADINIPTDKGLTFGDDGQKIESDGTDFTIASGAQLNLTATGNVSFGDGDITNVGTIDLDQIDPDGNTIGIGSAPSASGYFRIGATSAPASSTDYYQSIVGGRVNPVGGRRGGLFYVSGTIGTAADASNEHPLITAVNIGAPTVSAGGEDVGKLVTLYVAAAPSALSSGSVTEGGPHALWVDAGTSRFDGGVIIGASESTNNLIDDASTGSGSTTLYVGNQSITTSSDARLKENITDSTVNALDKIKELRVVDFDWVDPSDTSPNNKNARGRWTGMLAQETVETVPWIINAPRTEDGEIDHASSNTWFVDYQHLVPMLVKAIQQLEAKL